jgi:hypothetical protein
MLGILGIGQTEKKQYLLKLNAATDSLTNSYGWVTWKAASSCVRACRITVIKKMLK